MHRPSPPNPHRMYRSIGVQTGTASPLKQSCVQAAPFDAGGVQAVEYSNTSQFDGQSSSEQHPYARIRHGIKESAAEAESGGSPWSLPAAGRVFSLPAYLRDEALQQRMIAEGAVDDREESLMDRRVVSSSTALRRQPHTVYNVQLADGLNDIFTVAEANKATFEEVADTSGSSTESRLTVLVHESTSVNGEPQTPGAFFVDRSAGSTPDSVIIISDRDSDLIQPGSFLRSQTLTPPGIHQVQVTAGTEVSPARNTADTPSHVSQSSQVNIVEVLEQLSLSDESEEDELPPDSQGWIRTPPRPIPALHGPSSLPYARCPSGAEGEIFYNTQSVRDLVWDIDLQTVTREPPYLHPDYVAVVEYTEQSASKEESDVIVLVDTSLPTQRAVPRGGRSRSTFPQLPTPASGQIAPPTETRRANEWRAQPVRAYNAAHARREQPVSEEPPSPDFGSTGASLPTSNSNSSLGSGFTAHYHTPILGEDIPVHVEIPTSVFDPHVASEEQLRHYFIEREQRRLYLEEQYLQLELEERFRRLPFKSDEVSDFSQGRGVNGSKANTQMPLTMEHLNLYRNFLTSLDNQQRTGLNDSLQLNGPAHHYSQLNSFHPSLLSVKISGSVPPSLSNTRSEDTQPVSSILPSPIAPYTYDLYDSSPELAVHLRPPPPNHDQGSRGFGTGYLFPAGSVAAYAHPIDPFIQNRWEGTPNASLPASTMYYRDTDSANASLELRESHSYDTPFAQPALVQGPTHHDSSFKHHQSPVETSQTYVTSEDPATQSHVVDSTDLQSFRLPRFARRVSQSQSQLNQEHANGNVADEVQDHINDLDVTTIPTRRRSNTLSSMAATRGHRASTVRSLDLGKQQVVPETLTAASSSPMSRVRVPKSLRTSSLASEYWRTSAASASTDATKPADQRAKKWHTDKRPPINILKEPDVVNSRVSSQSQTLPLFKVAENIQPPPQTLAWRSAPAAIIGGRGERTKLSRKAQVEMTSRGSGK